jgi:hypothetical protein
MTTMSWWKLPPPADDPHKVERHEKMSRDISTALVELRRTMHHAKETRHYHFDPVLAEVNDTLKLMGD